MSIDNVTSTVHKIIRDVLKYRKKILWDNYSLSKDLKCDEACKYRIFREIDATYHVDIYSQFYKLDRIDKIIDWVRTHKEK